LLGFNFCIEFTLGASNVVTDALSHQDIEAAAELSVLSAPSFDIYDELRQEFDDQSSLHALHTAVLAGDRGDKW
jgi:hypothetical protein